MMLEQKTKLVSSRVSSKPNRTGAVLLALFALIALGSPVHAQKRIALTFDDIPREAGAFLTQHERTVKLIAALERADVKQAAFFVSAGYVGDPDRLGGEDRIIAYAAAGHVLANHSFSHRHLSEISAEDYLADLDKTESWLKGRVGRRPWFRFPYLDEGRTDEKKRDAVRAGLKARNLRNGYVTADGADWHIERLTQSAAQEGTPMDMVALRDFYVSTHLDVVNFNHALARRLFNREPIQVLLLHETDIAALYIEDLVAALRAQGWRIVTADEAFADPLNREIPDTPNANGTILSQVSEARGLPESAWPGAMREDVQLRLFSERVLKKDLPMSQVDDR